MRNKNNVIIWGLAVIAVLFAAYIYYSKSKMDNSAALQPNTVTNQTSVNTVPDFTLKDLDGKTVKLSDYKGKFVIINFWAVWCKYCKLEMPDLNDVNKTLEKDGDVVLLAVDVQESADIVKNYLSSNNLSLKVLLDKDGKVAQAYNITGFPTTYVINKDGSIYHVQPGATDKKSLQKWIDGARKGEPYK